MSSASTAGARRLFVTSDTPNPTGSAVAAAAVLAEAVSIAAHAEAAVAAQAAADARAAGVETSAGAVKAAARAEAAAAAAVDAADAAAAETTSARSAAVVTEADLSAATTAMVAAHSGPGTQADHSTDDRVEAALLAAAAAAAILATAVAGESEARSVAANKVALAVTVAATAAALTATANAAATRDDVTAAAVLSATITAVLAATVTAAQDTQREADAADLTSPGTSPETAPTERQARPADEALPTATVTRLTDLLDGLDDAVRMEWENYLSAPIAPMSLPGENGEEIGWPAPGGLSGLARDLSLARRIELALSRTADRTEVTFVNAPVALLHADFDGHHMIRFTRVNPALCALTGYTEAELLALDARALPHPGDDAIQSDVLENRYHPGDDRQEVLRWMHAEGHSIWVRLTLRPLLGDNGIPEQVVGQVEDVTARRRMESALRHSEKQFRTAFDNAPIPMMVIELTGARPATLLHANAAVSRLTGHTEDELKASDFPVLLGQALSGTETIRRAAGDYRAVNRYRHAAGHTFLVRCDAHLLTGGNGEPDTLLAQLSKVTPGDPAEMPDTFDRMA